MIKKAEIIRLEQGEHGTFGVLRLDDSVFCVTLEPPDKKNIRNVSCIPAGNYECTKIESPGFGQTYEIANVPERTHILFHAGNVSNDTKGCVLLGRQYGLLGADRAVLQSGQAFGEFLQRCSGADRFPLRIVNRYTEEQWMISA